MNRANLQRIYATYIFARHHHRDKYFKIHFHQQRYDQSYLIISLYSEYG